MANTTGQKFGGRKKGTPNKAKNTSIQMRLERYNFDPVKNMIEIGRQALAEGDLKLAMDANKELLQYIAPKRKAVEVTGEDGGPIQTQPIGISGIACNTDTGQA